MEPIFGLQGKKRDEKKRSLSRELSQVTEQRSANAGKLMENRE
jgi:hypothetical protein